MVKKKKAKRKIANKAKPPTVADIAEELRTEFGQQLSEVAGNLEQRLAAAETYYRSRPSCDDISCRIHDLDVTMAGRDDRLHRRVDAITEQIKELRKRHETLRDYVCSFDATNAANTASAGDVDVSTDTELFSEEIAALNDLASKMRRRDTTCMCDGCEKVDEFVERLEDLVKWLGVYTGTAESQ